jgi:hypothetical protein
MELLEKIDSAGADGLTIRQRAFVEAVAMGGLSLRAAAAQAGYSSPESKGPELARLPHIRAAVVARRQSVIETDLASLGLRTMRELMSDSMTPAPVRFQAAKWSLEAAGHSREQARAGLPPAEKSLSEMSVVELEEFIQRGESALGGLRRVGAPVIEVEAAATAAPASSAPAALPASGVAL